MSHVPRLAKGGKWVYGWVIVSPESGLPILPAAWCRFGFRSGDEALLLRGSRTSGGFSSEYHVALIRHFDAYENRSE